MQEQGSQLLLPKCVCVWGGEPAAFSNGQVHASHVSSDLPSLIP